MEVNDELVDKLANLARLKFEPSEKEEIKNDLQKMIAFVEKLNELDTKDIEPTSHVLSKQCNEGRFIGAFDSEGRSPDERPVMYRKILPGTEDNRINLICRFLHSCL